MRIIVLGSPRSKSNWAVSTIGAFYQIPNLYEPYRPMFDQLKLGQKNDLLSSDQLAPDSSLVNAITDKTSELSLTSGVLKLEVTHLTPRPWSVKLLDLELFKLHTYDMVFTTERANIVDMVCSHRVAMEYDRWIFSGDNTPPEITESLFFDPADRLTQITLNSCIWDTLVLAKAKEWITDKNIKFTPLFYETMQEVWPNTTQTQWHKTNYNYSHIFTNYDHVESIIENYKPKVSAFFTQIN